MKPMIWFWITLIQFVFKFFLNTKLNSTIFFIYYILLFFSEVTFDFGNINAKNPANINVLAAVKTVKLQLVSISTPRAYEPTTLPILPDIKDKQTAIALLKYCKNQPTNLKSITRYLPKVCGIHIDHNHIYNSCT